jgi:hypothetical protein
MSDLISLVSKRPGWAGGKVEKVYDSLKESSDRKEISKKMVVPSSIDIDKAYSKHEEGDPDRKACLFNESKETKKAWLTRAYLHFESSVGIQS